MQSHDEEEQTQELFMQSRMKKEIIDSNFKKFLSSDRSCYFISCDDKSYAK